MLSSTLEGSAGEGGAPAATGWTEVRWRVRAPSAGEGQVVCVVGSSEVLGAWNHDAALELAREEGKPDAWWGRARLARGVECRYKYFIREGAAIAKWESWRENRRLVPLGVELFVDDGRFGVEKTCPPSSSPSPSSPPLPSSSSSDVWEDYGWLVSDIQLRITLGAKSLEHHSKPRTPPVELRDSQLRPHKLVFSSKDPNIVAKSVFLDDDARDELKEHTFHTGGFSSLHLYADFFVAGSTTKVGRAIITPALLRDLIGTAAIPIVSPELEEVGIFAFEYLIVKPFEHDNLSDVLARTYWKSTKFVDVGHRGCGANRAVSKSGKKTVVSENTLLSFVRAGQLGRGAVEFDVQLSKDGVPVIFHDFLVPVDERGHYKVPVYSLTLQKFKELAKCSHSWSKDASGAVPYPARKGGMQHSSSKAKQVEPSEEPTLFPSAAEKHKLMRKRNSLGHVYHEGDENRPHTPLQDSFATLEEVFDIVPLSTGFNIEIKYPTIEQLAKGKVALYPERNQIVDAVLKVVFDHAKRDRSIIYFSSFDADVCTMLSLKQPRYPVFFLTQGGSKLCLDHRRNSVPQAIRFARSVNLLGLVVEVQPLLNAPELIKLVKSSGLLLATYGSPNNEQEYVRLQEEMGVDAVISDHLIVPQRKDASE